MPIRDALRALERDGFVALRFPPGGFDGGYRPEGNGELYEIREVVEMLAAKQAAPRITDEDLEGLRDKLGGWRKPIPSVIRRAFCS